MRPAFLFLLIIVTYSITAQSQKFWSATLCVGVNNPLVNDADTTVKVYYEDDLGMPKLGAETTTGSPLIPPLSFDVAYNLSERVAFGTRVVYQAHQEKTVVQSLTGDYISEGNTTKNAMLIFAEANYTWLHRAPFYLSSGGGVGYGWSNIKTATNKNASSFCFDLRVVTMRYDLCCGWSLLVDGRYTSSPTGIQKTAGYSVGFGVRYVFNH